MTRYISGEIRTIETCFAMTVLHKCDKCRNNYSDYKTGVISHPKIDKNCPGYIPCKTEINESCYNDLLDKEAYEKRLAEEIVYLQTTEEDYRKLSN